MRGLYFYLLAMNRRWWGSCDSTILPWYVIDTTAVRCLVQSMFPVYDILPYLYFSFVLSCVAQLSTTSILGLRGKPLYRGSMFNGFLDPKNGFNIPKIKSGATRF